MTIYDKMEKMIPDPALKVFRAVDKLIALYDKLEGFDKAIRCGTDAHVPIMKHPNYDVGVSIPKECWEDVRASLKKESQKVSDLIALALDRLNSIEMKAEADQGE